jgi:hypothetical protein
MSVDRASTSLTVLDQDSEVLAAWRLSDADELNFVPHPNECKRAFHLNLP